MLRQHGAFQKADMTAQILRQKPLKVAPFSPYRFTLLIQQTSSETVSRFIIDPVLDQDAGQIACEAANRYGRDEKTFILSIEGQETSLSQCQYFCFMKSCKFCLGRCAQCTVGCTAVGHQEPFVGSQLDWPTRRKLHGSQLHCRVQQSSRYCKNPFSPHLDL